MANGDVEDLLDRSLPDTPKRRLLEGLIVERMRGEANLTQEEFARQVGVPVSEVIKLEAGITGLHGLSQRTVGKFLRFIRKIKREQKLRREG